MRNDPRRDRRNEGEAEAGRIAARGRGLVVTHEMGFAQEVGDWVVFMDGGVIVEDGPAKQVIDTPKEERTERFVGLVLEH